MTSTGKELFRTQILTTVCVFNKSVLNVLSNFIPHETILCNDKDPLWFNSQVESLLHARNKVFKNHRKEKSNFQLLNKLYFFQERLNGLIKISKKSKFNCYERMPNKLYNPYRNSKPY